MEIKRTPVKSDWRVSSVSGDTSTAFASALQDELNRGAADGFSLVQMFQRGGDGDMILVHQRLTIVPAPAQDEAHDGVH